MAGVARGDVERDALDASGYRSIVGPTVHWKEVCHDWVTVVGEGWVELTSGGFVSLAFACEDANGAAAAALVFYKELFVLV